MSKMRPGCYSYCGRPAAVGRMFCSARCAGEYAEELIRGNEDQWCPLCEKWVHVESADSDGKAIKLGCGHVGTSITEGMRDADAREHYNHAIGKPGFPFEAK